MMKFPEKVDAGNSSSGASAQGTAISSSLSMKKISYKSFFPKLHNVSSRKKSFHHMVQLNLLEQFNVNEQSSTLTDKKSQGQQDDDLEEELEEER